MIYTDFKSILIPENNVEQNLDETHITIILLAILDMNWYVLMINLASLLSHIEVKILLISNCITNMVNESKFCSRVMKERFINSLL